MNNLYEKEYNEALAKDIAKAVTPYLQDKVDQARQEGYQQALLDVRKWLPDNKYILDLEQVTELLDNLSTNQ